MAGAYYKPSDYIYVSPIGRYILQTFRNSIGDIGTPTYSFWVDYGEQEDSGKAQAVIMIIWMTFVLINVILLSVVLINSLIAIVSQTFAKVQEKEIDILLSHCAHLNQYYTLINGKQSFKEEFSLIAIVRSAE